MRCFSTKTQNILLRKREYFYLQMMTVEADPSWKGGHVHEVQYVENSSLQLHVHLYSFYICEF
jgi:hypothetical protein